MAERGFSRVVSGTRRGVRQWQDVGRNQILGWSWASPIGRATGAAELALTVGRIGRGRECVNGVRNRPAPLPGGLPLFPGPWRIRRGPLDAILRQAVGGKISNPNTGRGFEGENPVGHPKDRSVFINSDMV